MPGSGRPTNRRPKGEPRRRRCNILLRSLAPGEIAFYVCGPSSRAPTMHDLPSVIPSRIPTGVTPDQLEFRVLRSAADALPIGEMSAQARALGISPARINVTAANAGRGHVLVTCSTEMANFSRRAIPRARGESQHERGRATADRRVDGGRRDLQGNRGGAPAGNVGRLTSRRAPRDAADGLRCARRAPRDGADGRNGHPYTRMRR